MEECTGEERASAKTLGQELVWCVRRTVRRPLWLRHRKEKRVMEVRYTMDGEQ